MSKKFVDNSMNMPCGDCGQPDLEQLVQLSEDGRLRCELCWQKYCHWESICPECGFECESVQTTRCYSCLAGEIRDRVANTRSAFGIW
jgi:hypothetical protein